MAVIAPNAFERFPNPPWAAGEGRWAQTDPLVIPPTTAGPPQPQNPGVGTAVRGSPEGLPGFWGRCGMCWRCGAVGKDLLPPPLRRERVSAAGM